MVVSFKARIVGITLCLLIGASPVVTLSASEKIGAIRVEAEPQGSISEELVQNIVRSAKGKDFSEQVLSEDIKRLYRSDVVQDVSAQVRESPEGEKLLIFEVEAVPELTGITFEGNEQLSDKKLRNAMDLSSGELLSPIKLKKAKQVLLKQYNKKNFSNVVISYKKKKIEDRSVRLIWQIDEGSRHKVKTVKIRGNIVFPAKRLKKEIKTGWSFWSLFFNAGFFNQEVFERDKRRLRRFYRRHGYLDFQISSVEKEYVKDNKRVVVILNIEEGPLYKVGNVSVEGCKRFSTDELKSLIELTTGMNYSIRAKRNDIEAIKDKYAPEGYYDIGCRALLEKNAETGVVNVTYRVQEGEPQEIRDIFIRNNRVTDDRVIRRELAIVPGAPLNRNKIEQSKKRLKNLNYFSSVNIEPRSTPESNTKDVGIRVQEKETGRLMLSAGVSTESGVVGGIQLEQANFDITDWPRFTGAGQHFKANIQAGTERTDGTVSFVEPWLFGKRLRLKVKGYHTVRDQDEYEEKHVGGEVQLTRPISLQPRMKSLSAWWQKTWRQTFGVRIQEVDVRDFDSGVTQELQSEEGSYTSNALSFAMELDTRDSYMAPTEGMKTRLRTELQPTMLGSYGNIYKLRGNVEKYTKFENVPLAGEVILKSSANIGVVDEFDDEEGVAIFDRFFAGGQSTLRGFEYREVSPVDAQEDPLGGKSVFLGTLEFMKPLTEVVQLRTFCDVGNVWTDSWGWNPAELNASVGLGLSLNFRQIPIRMDYGIPIRTELDHLDDSGRFHFNLGYLW